jgi:hypothetical protein
VLKTIGMRVLKRAFENSVDAIESRNASLKNREVVVGLRPTKAA